MQITRFFCYIFATFLQVVALHYSYSIFGNKRKISNIYFFIFSILFILVATLLLYFIKIPGILITMMMFICFLYSILFKISLIKRIFVCVTINILSSLFEIIFGLLITVIYTVSIEEIQINMVLYIQAILLSKLSLIVIAKILSCFIKKGREKIKGWLVSSFLVIPITTFVIMYTISLFTFSNEDSRTQMLAIISSIILIVSNVFTFYLFDYINKHAYKESKLEFQSALFDHERQYYKDLLNNEYISNKTIHDLKNELFAIRSLLEINPKSAYSEINKICDVVDKNNIIKICTSDAINSLVTSKVKNARDNGIDVTINSFVTSLKAINSVDLCMILGNLFDNAIEACMGVKGEKSIFLELRSRDECISITMKNITTNECVMIGKTTKMNKSIHGFGLDNIAEILRVYNGFMTHKIENGYFIINVILQGGEKDDKLSGDKIN